MSSLPSDCGRIYGLADLQRLARSNVGHPHVASVRVMIVGGLTIGLKLSNSHHRRMKDRIARRTPAIYTRICTIEPLHSRDKSSWEYGGTSSVALAEIVTLSERRIPNLLLNIFTQLIKINLTCMS